MCPIAFLCALIYALTCMALLSPLAVLTCITCVLACAGSGTHKCSLLLPCMAAGVSIQGRTVSSKPPPPLHKGAEKRPGWPRAIRRRRESWRELFGKAGNFEKSILSPPLIINDLTVYCKLHTSIFCQSSYKKKLPF